MHPCLCLLSRLCGSAGCSKCYDIRLSTQDQIDKKATEDNFGGFFVANARVYFLEAAATAGALATAPEAFAAWAAFCDAVAGPSSEEPLRVTP